MKRESGGQAVRSDDLIYAIAVAVLMGWLLFGTARPQPAPPARELAARAAVAPPVQTPRLAARARIDDRPFDILVGEGPRAIAVAVSSEAD
jgi:hypothetical protein